MKKLILSAFCLSVMGTSATMIAGTTAPQSVISVSIFNDERKVIKVEELPEGIKKALSTDAYKGWKAKEATMVNKSATPVATTTAAADAPAAADASITTSHYEVVLTDGKDTKTVKFQKDGTLLN